MLKLITGAQARLNSLRVDEDGNAAEYGLIIALIAVVIIGGLTALGVALAANFNQIAGAL
ncbi:Flp family type IVb pilin [Agromyces tardus]|uniref:Flp family type IVb pilin n=1 Tax=Agromyces tardus TaxID=2583849 RepID=A0A3M8AKU4_9MICO|nr:Flp family type IVb pilin [Agromyces tardus]RNB51075.1 Flp family type IVb pilin [Agromyces tardus]